MFLTMLDHRGHTWMVELQAIPNGTEGGLLEFSFSRRGVEEELRLTWQVSSESLLALSEEGIDVSEELLRRQLDSALAEARHT